MATRASTTTTRMAAATSTAAVGSRPKMRCSLVLVRGEAATSPLPVAPRLSSFVSTVVDELDDWPGIGAWAEGDADGVSLFGAEADDEELEVLDLSPGVLLC